MEQFFRQAAIESKRNEQQQHSIVDQFVEHVSLGHEAKVNEAASRGLKSIILFTYDEQTEFNGIKVSDIVINLSDNAIGKLKRKFKPAYVNITFLPDHRATLVLDWSGVRTD